jgi:hypothetical protein
MSLTNPMTSQEIVGTNDLKQLPINNRRHLRAIFTREIQQNMAPGPTKNIFLALHPVFLPYTGSSKCQERCRKFIYALITPKGSFQSCT